MEPPIFEGHSTPSGRHSLSHTLNPGSTDSSINKHAWGVYCEQVSPGGHVSAPETPPSDGGAQTGQTRETRGFSISLPVCLVRIRRSANRRVVFEADRRETHRQTRRERRGFSASRLCEPPRRAGRGRARTSLAPPSASRPRSAREGSGAGARTQGVGGAPPSGTRTGWSLP